MLRAAVDQHVNVLVSKFAQGGAQPMTMDYGFDPEAVEALATAFHKSWSFISNDPLFAERDPKRLQRRLAQYLMQLAAKGERSPLRLANGAISRMRHDCCGQGPNPHRKGVAIAANLPQ
jgi:hypothetical protein